MSSPSHHTYATASNTTPSTGERGTTVSETPFHLAEYFPSRQQTIANFPIQPSSYHNTGKPPSNKRQHYGNHRYHHNNDNDDSDTFSATSHISLQSSTDGIDVLGGGGGSGRDVTSVASFLVWLRLQAGRIVSRVWFKRSVLALIFGTTILLGVRTMDALSDEAVAFMDDVLRILLWVFTVELLTQIAFYQTKVLSTGWLLADLVVVVISWYTGDETCLVLRGFRLLRALRKATGIPALKWAVKAMLRVLPRLTAVLAVLLPGMFAIFAILFTNLYGEAEDVSRPYFHRLDAAAWTLFEIMTGGRDWAEIAAELEDQYPWAWAPLMLFVSVALFFFGSLIIAVMCDAVSTINREQVWKTLDHRAHGSFSSRGNDRHPHIMSYSMDELMLPHSSSELQKLERKIDELASTVDSLVRMQIAMQETVAQLARVPTQEQQPQGNATANSASEMLQQHAI